MNLRFALAEQFDAAVHQKSAKDVHNPVKSLDEPYARRDENRAHDQRP